MVNPMKMLLFHIAIAHILLLISFQGQVPFWPWFSFSLIILLIIGFKNGTLYNSYTPKSILIVGGASGLLLYIIFWVGKLLSGVLYPPLIDELYALYNSIKPKLLVQYLLVFSIIIAGEEIFWRGYVQTKFMEFMHSKHHGVIMAALFYATANIFAGSLVFVLATFVAGCVWGYLYSWKRNIVLNIFSHIVFNLFLLVFFPLF